MIEWRCPDCKGPLQVHPDNLRCANCAKSFEVHNQIPHFVVPPVDSLNKFAIAEQFFHSARLYEWFVSLKWFLFADKKIGAQKYVTGKVVLDAGCGPSLRLGHLEYDPEQASHFAAFDLSPEFVRAAQKENPHFQCCVASVTRIPFPDKSFDTSFLSFVLHHVPEDPREVISEVMRVTRGHIIIYDHLRSTSYLPRAIQDSYWRFMDGGTHYLTINQWEQALKPLYIKEQLQTGAIFRHVVKFICEVP